MALQRCQQSRLPNSDFPLEIQDSDTSCRKRRVGSTVWNWRIILSLSSGNLSGMQWFISIRDGRRGLSVPTGGELAHNGTNTKTALRMRSGRPAVVVEQNGFEAEAGGFVGESVVVSTKSA